MYNLFDIAAIGISYFIGNISPASLLSKAAGLDIRKEGSGNPGTTNVLRVMGKKAAALTLLIDVAKGVLAVFIGRFVGGESLALYCGLAVFIGHIYPSLYRFKGGKGIATALGVLLALNLYLALACLAIALAGIVIFQRVSVGSLMAALALPVFVLKFMPDAFYIMAAMALLVLYKHRGNIQRIVKGQEPKINLKSKKDEEDGNE